jgi:hypothetical protein
MSKEFLFPKSEKDWKNNYISIPLKDLFYHYKLGKPIYISKNHYFQYDPDNPYFIENKIDEKQGLKNALFSILTENTKKTLKFYIKNV